MNIPLLTMISSLLDCLSAQSLSMATGRQHISVSCIPTKFEGLTNTPELIPQVFQRNSFPDSGIESVQIMWAGPEGMGRIGPCTPQNSNWSLAEVVPGTFSPVFSILLKGDLENKSWIYGLNAPQVYLNGEPLNQGLEFELDGKIGRVIYDASIDQLTLAWPGQLTEVGQAGCLVVQLLESPEITDLPAFCREMAAAMRTRFLKTDRDFSPDELRQAVDPSLLSGQAMDGLKQVVGHPQDLAALLGLGLQLAPHPYRPGDEWEVQCYLLDPLVLPGFGPAACLDGGLPIAVETLAPIWARRVIPEISETLPGKLSRPSEALAVYLVETIQAGPYRLPYLLMEAGNRITAYGEPFTAQRPLFLLARQGHRVRALVGDLLRRERLLAHLASRFGQPAELERQRVIGRWSDVVMPYEAGHAPANSDRHRLKIDPLLVAIWLVSQAANPGRGQAASLGKLRKKALSLSLSTMAEIEKVRRLKPDLAADQALVQAIQVLQKRRQQLLARLLKEVSEKTNENRQMEA